MFVTTFSPVLLLLVTTLWTTHAYRIKGSVDENRPFIPFEKGFVQSIQDPKASITNRTITNQGRTLSLSTTAQRRIENDGNRLFNCPNMVGPFYDENDGNDVDDDFTTSNGYYYCTSNRNGYCDRRSGTCFCNEGYIGDGCESCDTLTHIDVGGMMCHPKRLCPNDCSNSNYNNNNMNEEERRGGVCNYITGKCECSNHRTGDDCSQSKCSLFHHFCTHCNDEKCLQCEDGWSVVDHHDDNDDRDKSIASLPSPTTTSTCEPCWRYDPRCRECNSKTCTSCIDLLLLSIHRSGRRPQDPPLPIDELSRELSVTVPFGSLNDDAYYDAEHYFLVGGDEGPTTSLAVVPPLNESAVECHQGLNSDDTITCIPYNLTSHIVCGNYGTITFDSPEYAIREDEKDIRLTLQRSGGGVGEVSVSYSIYPITATIDDVTSTAYYTTNQTVVFRPGQIRASFLVTINDDRVMEANETFSVHLSKPTGGCQLGTQSRTIVTIIDDDELRTCSNETYVGLNRQDLGSDVVAGTPLNLTVIAKKCNGDLQTVGMDVIRVEAQMIRADNVAHELNAPVIVGKCRDSNNGTYACDVAPTVSGNYQLDVYLLVPGGLKGFYYTDNYLSDERLSFTRTDAVVNFTWGEGGITTFGRDFVSVRWEGYVMPSCSEVYTFWLDVDDHVRLWVDGILLIDSWTFSSSSPDTLLRADWDLTAMVAYEVILEYREITGNATARLLWSSPSTHITAIPSSSLFYKVSRNNKILLS